MNHFRPYQKGDLARVWADLRPEDYREYAAVGATDHDLLEGYLMLESQRVQTWDTEDGPVLIFGVTPSWEPGVGLIWAIATPAAEARWRFIARHTNKILSQLGEGYLVLSNYKDARNTRQINWLRRLGFTFIRRLSGFGGGPHDFLEFVRIVP